MRKQSDPPQLKSRDALFNSLKLGITAPNFSAGNISDEPHSAASFSANGFGNSDGKHFNVDASSCNDSPETPTLPGRGNSPMSN